MDTDGHTVHLKITGSTLLDVSGHSVTYADGLIVTKGQLMFDQPNISRADVVTIEGAVRETVLDHERESKLIGDTPVITTRDLERPKQEGSQCLASIAMSTRTLQRVNPVS